MKMKRTTAIVALVAVMSGCTTVRDGGGALLSDDGIQFLTRLADAVVDSSRVFPGETIRGYGPNTSGGTVIRPGGRDAYPAFWIRDYAMSLESGLIPLDEQLHLLLLTANNQQDEEWQLPSGSVVTPGSIPDHISFGGRPIFYPGTIEDYEGQGGERWGYLPSLDDAYFFIHMTAFYVRDSGNPSILQREIRGKPLFQRLEEAYDMPPSRVESGLVYAEEDRRGVTFGFVDTINHTGELLFCSLLKYRAAEEIVELAALLGDAETATRYRDAADKLKRAIAETFALEEGFLKASTERSAQQDVWGTAFAVYVGALDADTERRACEALARAYREGTIAWQGNIRHVPTTGDFSAESAWELSLGPKNEYQNGAYWGTPAGWVAYAIAQVDRETARTLAEEFVAELREGDFRNGAEFGSPWECFHPDGDHRQNPVYMTSVTVPLAAFRRFATERH